MGEDPLSVKNILKSKKIRLIIAISIFVVGMVCFLQFGRFELISKVQAAFIEGVGQSSVANILPDYAKKVSMNANEEEKVCSDVDNVDQSIEVIQTISAEDVEKEQFKAELHEMLAGYPMDEMVPYIAEYDREIAALIVGIGKKESNWGKRSPSKDGKTCYNYWGYKGAGTAGIAMGHGCFSTPEEGVSVIAKRIESLAAQGINTPSEMLVWKCGRSCAGHAPGTPEKWVSDVSIYYNKLTLK